MVACRLGRGHLVDEKASCFAKLTQPSFAGNRPKAAAAVACEDYA